MATPTNPQDDCKSLYVGNLGPKVTQALLFEVFSSLGLVTSVKLITDKITQQNMGYGFVDYADHQTAEAAMNGLNGRDLYGQELRINWAVAGGNKEDTSAHHHIFVGDLSPEVDDNALWEAFKGFGSLSDARIMRDPTTRSRGYGFVAFREHTDAQQAMRMMTGVFLGSRAIRCNWANQKSAAKPSTSKSSDYESVLYQTPSTNTTIYVGNIAPDTTEVMVRDVFEEFGAIEDVRIQGDKGYAFVKFQTHQTAADAIINGTGKIMGMRTIRCSWGKEKSAGDSVTVPVSPMMGGYPMMMNPMMMMPGAGMGGYGMMGQGNMAQMGMYGMPQMGMYGMPQTQMYPSTGTQNRQGGQRK